MRKNLVTRSDIITNFSISIVNYTNLIFGSYSTYNNSSFTLIFDFTLVNDILIGTNLTFKLKNIYMPPTITTIDNFTISISNSTTFINDY
jgi:hypothetical protein